MQLSYWEYKTWFSNIDFTVVGSGIVGLSAALRLRVRFPKATILVLEKGVLPQGASTKNAGFACFGSVSELLSDLKTHTPDEVFDLVKKRVRGLELLRKTIGDVQLDYQKLGGYELFSQQDSSLFETCTAAIPELNKLLNPLFNKPVFHLKETNFGFENVQKKFIYNAFEGQLDTGKMMQALLKKCKQADIQILNGIAVTGFEDDGDQVALTIGNFYFKTKKLCIATNGFSKQLGFDEVKPARAQVLITEPIINLKVRGTFHLDEGYYYFRNINNRILLGGGRNLDFKTEETAQFGQTTLVQEKLEALLKEVILPGRDVQVDYYWSGIMGVGNQKKPIVKQVSKNVFCGIRLGGMGVAIGSMVGQELVDLIED